MLKYTICFIRRGTHVLLINREKSAWMGSWNGVGGRIEPGESPSECALREVREETGIALDSVQYKGVVTWTVDGVDIGGMYAFVAAVGPEFRYATPIATREGILDWKTFDWIMHPKNTGIATNIPHFLPKMLSDAGLYEYVCVYENNRQVSVQSKECPSCHILSVCP